MTEEEHIAERRTIAPVIGRIASVLFFVSLMLLSLYALGIAQLFLDGTLLWLLGVMEISLVVTAVFALCSCCLFTVHTIAGRWQFAALPTVLSLLATVITLVLLASLRMLLVVFGVSSAPSIPLY